MGAVVARLVLAMTLVVMLLSVFAGHTDAGLPISKRELFDVFKPSEVCYDGFGCFSTGGNFYDPKIRPVQALPQSPQQVDPTFWLFTRSNVLDANVLKYTDAASISASKYNPKNPTKIIVHGWIESGDKPWVVEMKKALLSFGDYNVIQLDWSKANGIIYEQSTANTRMVGAIIARMVMLLESNFGANREDFHIIGHSLGSHIAGYAGARLRDSESKQLGRITGLDPAGPYFEFTHPEVRLDPTDARFVDAIHTDGSDSTNEHLFASFVFDAGVGLMQPVGHLDFYPNGGMTQPGCTKNIFMRDILKEGIIEAGKWTLAACDHMRATILFTATAANPTADFQAYECDSYTEFKAGRCLTCAGNKCAFLGIRAIEWNPNGRTNVKVWSDTQPTEPFYAHHYAVRVGLANSGFSKQSGDMTVTLMGTNSQTTAALPLLTGGNFEPGQSVQGLITSGAEIGGVSGLNVGWKSNSWFNFFSTPKVAIGGANVFEGISQKSTAFCGNVAIDSGKSGTLPRC